MIAIDPDGERVRAVAFALHELGLDPTAKLVASRLGLSVSTAEKWVARLRRAGAWPPRRPARPAPPRPPKRPTDRVAKLLRRAALLGPKASLREQILRFAWQGHANGCRVDEAMIAARFGIDEVRALAEADALAAERLWPCRRPASPEPDDPDIAAEEDAEAIARGLPPRPRRPPVVEPTAEEIAAGRAEAIAARGGKPLKEDERLPARRGKLAEREANGLYVVIRRGVRARGHG